jgi:hypothetical protein
MGLGMRGTLLLGFVVLLAGCGDSASVKQTADQVTVTVTVTETTGAATEETTSEESTDTEADEGLASTETRSRCTATKKASRWL